jgi:L,D-peptidoglycan transpeptidase YkuD (ErfK/YbiS/YcfS/YnhG family)
MQEDVESGQQVLVIVKAGMRQVLQGGRTASCAIGRAGALPASAKHEGDGATPLGTWPLRRLFWRPDGQAEPSTQLETQAIQPDMGWCDDPASPAYNRLVVLPFTASHEKMWRDDHLYDLVIELGYNDSPPEPGRGSAIFLHLAHPDYRPTEGCVAVDRATFLDLARRARPGDTIRIEA